jgi:hypothetical protein
MISIDPNLPTQLRWAAGKVDAIVADPFWRAPIWGQHAFGGFGSVGATSYSVGEIWASNLWVGRAAAAHNQELDGAKRQVETAYRQLMALRDELERQAQATAAQIEAQRIIDQLTDLLRGL